MRWLDLLSSLRPEDFTSLKELLEREFDRPFTDIEVRDAARRLSAISDLVFLTDNQPEGGRGEKETA